MGGSVFYIKSTGKEKFLTRTAVIDYSLLYGFRE